MERWSDMPKNAQPEASRAGTPLAVCLEEAYALSHSLCSIPFHVVTPVQWAELRAPPNSGPSVKFIISFVLPG